MKFGVIGAGAIGATLGIKLSSVGVPVAMVNRSKIIPKKNDLFVRDLTGRIHSPGGSFKIGTEPKTLADVDVCLVAVKSGDTESAGATLASVLRPDVLVISFQNGLRNPERLRRSLTTQKVLAGMISTNIVRPTSTEYRQATSGPLVTGAADGENAVRLEKLREAFARAGDRLEVREDIAGVQAGKLLLNLNNGVCAVTGATIAESIRSRRLRRCFSQLIKEGIKVLRKAGFRPRAVVGAPPGIIAAILPMPDAIVLRAARSMVSIDPSARSSTLQDLLAGRPTEIDDMCGEIVRLGEETGIATPLNRLVTTLVHELEERAPEPRFLDINEFCKRLNNTAV